MAHPLSVFDIAGRAMSAQMVRLNTTASNMANASTVSGSEATAFRALKPVFRAVGDDPASMTVQVDRITQASTAPARRHDPGHPLADANGDVWDAAVDTTAEMVEMIEAARQYQNNVQVMDTARTLILDTLKLGK